MRTISYTRADIPSEKPGERDTVLHQLDITAPELLEIEWDAIRKVLYIHDRETGSTVLRACRVQKLMLKGLVFEEEVKEQGSFW